MTENRPRDPAPVGELLQPLLARLGIPNVSLLIELTDRWDELAGSPWAGASRPQILRRGELVVEATTPAAVRMLRYAAESLAKRLSDHFGAGLVASVRVVPPPR